MKEADPQQRELQKAFPFIILPLYPFSFHLMFSCLFSLSRSNSHSSTFPLRIVAFCLHLIHQIMTICLFFFFFSSSFWIRQNRWRTFEQGVWMKRRKLFKEGWAFVQGGGLYLECWPFWSLILPDRSLRMLVFKALVCRVRLCRTTPSPMVPVAALPHRGMLSVQKFGEILNLYSWCQEYS